MTPLGKVLLAIMAGTILVMPAAAQKDDGPPLPFEDVGACPFEGCVYRVWVANAPVTLRTERRVNAPIVSRLNRGEKVTGVSGVVLTTRPGTLRFQTPSTVATSAGAFQVEPDEVFYLLTYQGEGHWVAWFRGRLLEYADLSWFTGGADCDPPTGKCPAYPLTRPETAWWVQIRTSRGEVGWTDTPEKFDCKDAFGWEGLAKGLYR